jgi:hypothetical protein
MFFVSLFVMVTKMPKEISQLARPNRLEQSKTQTRFSFSVSFRQRTQAFAVPSLAALPACSLQAPSVGLFFGISAHSPFSISYPRHGDLAILMHYRAWETNPVFFNASG